MNTPSPTVRHFLLLSGFWLIAAMAPSLLNGGTVAGTVTARGPQQDGTDSGTAGNYGSRRYKFLEQIDYDSMVDFVVYIESVEKPIQDGIPPPVASIAQSNGMFVPHILPVQVGTVIVWPNRDDIYHNVFSLSDNTPFDLGLYSKDEEPKRVTFLTPGKVDVFCSIHTKMNCIVLVLPNPWFAKTDRHGRYRIEGIPAGTYRLRAWHERLPARTEEIVVPEDGDVSMDFELGFASLPKI